MNLTNQKVFNRVYEHFILDNEPFSKVDGESHYIDTLFRTHCPVGLFLEDIYEEAMEEFAFMLLKKNYPAVQKVFKGVDEWLVVKLQEAHDISETKEELEKELLAVAKDFKLQVPKTRKELA